MLRICIQLDPYIIGSPGSGSSTFKTNKNCNISLFQINFDLKSYLPFEGVSYLTKKNLFKKNVKICKKSVKICFAICHKKNHSDPDQYSDLVGSVAV